MDSLFYIVSAIIAIALYAGLRRAEVLHLRYLDVDLEQGLIRVDRGKGRGGGKDRVLPIGPELRSVLDDYLRDEQSVTGPRQRIEQDTERGTAKPEICDEDVAVENDPHPTLQPSVYDSALRFLAAGPDASYLRRDCHQVSLKRRNVLPASSNPGFVRHEHSNSILQPELDVFKDPPLALHVEVVLGVLRYCLVEALDVAHECHGQELSESLKFRKLVMSDDVRHLAARQGLASLMDELADLIDDF